MNLLDAKEELRGGMCVRDCLACMRDRFEPQGDVMIEHRKMYTQRWGPTSSDEQSNRIDQNILVHRTKMNFVFVRRKNVFMLCWYSCHHKGRILQE
jgi:hypothetical protein